MITKFIHFCIVSNEVPETPVISPVSGCIYERRLIEKYIAENGSDPMNGDKLSIDMLVEVKSKYFIFILEVVDMVPGLMPCSVFQRRPLSSLGHRQLLVSQPSSSLCRMSG